MPNLTEPILVPAIRLDREGPAEEARAIERARQPWVAGFILFGGEAEQVRRLTERVRDAAGRPIFIASDMERGAGQQIEGLTHLPDAGLVGRAGSPADAYALGDITAREARSVGIDVIFAPDADVRSELDNPILGNRAFGFEPGRVAVLAAAMAAGIRAAGALPVAKHFPGHGATREDSHEAVPTVAGDLETLSARDLAPFRHLIVEAGCPAVMTAHVAYPELDPSGAIATFSPRIVGITRVLAAQANRSLLVVTDAMLMAGAGVEGGEPEAGRRALRAGCDALLYPEYPEQVAESLLDSDGDGDLAAEAERAAHEVERFLALGAAVAAGTEPPLPHVAGAPDRVAARAVRLCAEGRLEPEPDAVLVVDDDDVPGRGDALAARAAREQVSFERVRVPREERPALAEVPSGRPGRTSRTIVVMASARGWKGASHVSEACAQLVAETRDRLADAGESAQVIWLTPRPESGDDVHLPGMGPHLERALGDALFPDEPPITLPVGHDP